MSGASMGSSARFPWMAVTAVAIAALAVRLIWLALGGAQLRFPDEARFWCEATSVAAGGPVGCRGKLAHDMPLTGLLVGALVGFTGAGVFLGKVFMVVVSAFTVFPVAGMAWSIRRQPMVAVLAAAAFALYPFAVFYSTLLLSESLFLLLLSLGTMLWLQALEGGGDSRGPRGGPVLGSGPGCNVGDGAGASGTGPSGASHLDWRHGILLGLAIGLAHLTRPALMYFVPIAMLWLVGTRAQSWRYVGAASLVICLVVSPWVIRNYQAFGVFVPGTLTSGQVLLEGNNPRNTDGGVLGAKAGYLRGMPGKLDELERDQWKKAKALEHIRADPWRFVELAWKKLKRFWNPVPNAAPYDRGIYRWISLLAVVPVFALAAAFPFLSVSSWRQWGFVLGLVGYYSAVHMVAVGSIRYRLPLEPILLAMACASLGAAWNQRRPR